MQKPIRVLLAKGGLDGHDRGALVVAAGLRDAKFEVIYVGINQSPEEIVLAALQEDVDVIGVSTHSGGHKHLFSRISELLGRKRNEFVMVVGGIIPTQDHVLLKRLGVHAIFGPGTSVQDVIAPRIRELCEQHTRSRKGLVGLYHLLRKGGMHSLARMITYLADGDSEARDLFAGRRTSNDTSHVVGFSGQGGAGKSTLIARTIKWLAPRHSLGVIHVDPCAVSGGAFLGDRIRMDPQIPLDFPEVFVRSIAAHEIERGVTPQIPDILDALRSANKRYILLESVGSGQHDEGFSELVDTFVYVVTPGMGDAIQMLKGGAIEKADIIVLNKADEDGASATESALKKFFEREREDGWKVPIITVGSLHGIGDQVWFAVQSHEEFLATKKSP